MVKLFGNKKTPAFGLDISDTSIKVMQLAPQAFSNLALSDKVINNHMIVNQQRLADNIKRAVELAGKINTKYVVCSIPEAKSFVRTVSIPRMPLAEIDGALPYELEQDIPIPVDQVYLDWQLLRETPDKYELLVTAAPKDYVDSLVEALELAKLRPLAMELESQATARALIGPEYQDKTVLIADMATQQTSFIIVDHGTIEYTSSIPIAGESFTESIARNLNVPKSEAEQLKRANGLTVEAKDGAIRKAILPILDNIVDEVKNVVRFFEEHDSAHRSIQDIILSGGSAQLSGLMDYITARINLGSGRMPIKVEMQKEISDHATVMGLAMRGADYEESN